MVIKESKKKRKEKKKEDQEGVFVFEVCEVTLPGHRRRWRSARRYEPLRLLLLLLLYLIFASGALETSPQTKDPNRIKAKT